MLSQCLLNLESGQPHPPLQAAPQLPERFSVSCEAAHSFHVMPAAPALQPLASRSVARGSA